MDLKKVVVYEDGVSFNISDLDIHTMEERGNLWDIDLQLFSFNFIALYPSEGSVLRLLVVNRNDEMDRYFADFEVKLSNGLLYKDSFWNHTKIPFFTFEDLARWKSPREVRIKCKIGYYYGIDEGNAEWQNMLTEIDDFSTVLSPPSTFTDIKEYLFKESESTNVSIICEDEKVIKAHQYFLSSSSFFSACFKYAQRKIDQNIAVHLPADSNTVKTLITFLYSGRIGEDQNVNWADLFVLAMYCNLSYLANQCQLQIIMQVLKNMEDLKCHLKFANRFHAKKLRMYVVYICRKLQEGLF